jgi:ABC-type hemin transport system ATPase subunit
MRAHENPFRISRAQALAFRGPLSRDQLLVRLAALDYRGAVVGPEGSGKSTLLRELEADLSAAGLRTRLLRFDDLAMLHRVERETILMIDGAEKLPWPFHAVVALTTPRLIVTAHGRREWLPVLLECAASAELMEELVVELVGWDSALLARARDLFEQKRGNMRQVFGALYDVLAAST